MNTPGLYIDCEGRVNHKVAHRLRDDELLSVAQLNFHPVARCHLANNLAKALQSRGLAAEFTRLVRAERYEPNH